MRGLGLALVLWVLGATVASAAVLRIDVTGTPTSASIGNGILLPLTSGGPTFAGVALADVQSSSRPDILSLGDTFLSSSTGYVEIDLGGITPRISDCGGLFVVTCNTNNGFGFQSRLLVDFFLGRVEVLALDAGSESVHSIGNLSYFSQVAFCSSCRVTFGGEDYLATLASVRFEATITSLRVSVLDQPTPVPLPSSAPLAMAGLGALGLLRRRAKPAAGVI